MLLKKGDNNEDVKKLQIKLGVDPIGNFGPKTETAVKAFQAANGLTASGIVDDATWNKIMGITPVVAIPAVITVPAQPTILVSPFKLDKLKGHIPDSVIAAIPDTAAKFNITNVLRLAHFLAQAGHESGQFKATSENLNYSSKGLLGIFPRYFTPALAESYARQPQKIANRVYGGRMGNGAEATGDGYKFRGRGYIQLTGKDNYTAFDKTVPEDILANPDLVSTKYALASAAWFFNKNGLWSICDKGADQATVTAVTKRVNGGTIGLPDRIKHFNEYYNLLK
jgi:putative chitinase